MVESPRQSRRMRSPDGRRYKTREAAIQQAHAYDLDAYTDEERAYWRSVLAELRAYRGTVKVNGARFS